MLYRFLFLYLVIALNTFMVSVQSGDIYQVLFSFVYAAIITIIVFAFFEPCYRLLCKMVGME